MNTKAKNPEKANEEGTVIVKAKKRTPINKVTKATVQEQKKSVKSKQTAEKKTTDDKNIKDTVKTIVTQERDLFYKYPEDIDNPLDRKKWRQATRNKMRAFERNLSKVEDTESKEYRKLDKEYKAYRKEVLMVP